MSRRYERDNSGSRALVLIEQRIRELPAFPAARAAVVAAAVAVCRGRGVPEMRGLGGISAVLGREIDSLPVECATNYGSPMYPRSIADVLRTDVGGMREDVSFALTRELAHPEVPA